ncbi:glycosyltransferase family 4 protein [Hyphococcus flavus]|uniref:Glycosyltransferase family 4 protein n=1 Tax=Hyphococcus flavus TaxID=1866326 RepID=A0AAE9ZDU6_9PROT|nr:glycosyltransferase family 4 protein [Hyphococcus flavus]WDI32989.1 glycosyltransferase family 4 protein [Hyphococcus flavus]
MKVLYSHRTQSADGQWVHIEALTRALEARGHEIIMAGPASAGAKQLDAKKPGLRAHLPGAIYECAEFAYSARGYVRMAKCAQAQSPDVLYERYNLHYFAGVWLRRRTGVPLILEVNSPLAEERKVHGNLAFKGFARRNEAMIWRAADKVLPVTNTLAEYVRAAGVAEENIEVIQNGVDQAFLEHVDPSPVRERYGLQGKLVLGFSGFVREWHGVDRALRYLAQSGREDLHLLVVGDGPAIAPLQSLAQELGVAQQLTVTGVVQRDAMPTYVSAFDIALQPAVVEYASPLKLFEYMALGKPVLAPDAPNIMEVLKDGEDGLLFRGEGFAAALDMLVNKADLRRKLGAGARETIQRQDYTWAGNARRVETIMEKLARQRHDNRN